MFRWVPPIRFHIAEILGWYIPRGRILRFERFLDVKKGYRFVWICHDCHEGVVVPGSYINIHGEEDF
jgi:hypothetical protein